MRSVSLEVYLHYKEGQGMKYYLAIRIRGRRIFEVKRTGYAEALR